MKKKELIQLIKDSAVLDYGDRTVALHLTNVFNTVVGQLFTDPNQKSFYAKQVKIAVDNREADIRQYPIMQDKFNSKGVVRIYPTGSQCSCLPDYTEFFPAPPYAARSGSMANNIGDMVFYTVTAEKIKFNKSLNRDVTELYADMVLEFSYYSDEDMIPLPNGVAQMIVDATVQSLRGESSHQNIHKTKTQ